MSLIYQNKVALRVVTIISGIMLYCLIWRYILLVWIPPVKTNGWKMILDIIECMLVGLWIVLHICAFIALVCWTWM